MKPELFEAFSRRMSFKEVKSLYPEYNDQLIYRYGRLQKKGSELLDERKKKKLLEVK